MFAGEQESSLQNAELTSQVRVSMEGTGAAVLMDRSLDENSGEFCREYFSEVAVCGFSV